MATIINPKILKWFEGRGISAANVQNTGIYSGRHVPDGDSFRVVPDPAGNVIVFPYTRHGETVNEKYRAAGKRFYQRPGGKKIFWNADVLDDPALHEGRAALVVCEGEMDCLSVMEAGNPFVVSVPDGAPPGRDAEGNLIIVSEGIADLDPDHDDKFRYIVADWDALKKIKRIVIATDADEPGRRLGEELVRRLGRARCAFVVYPEGCKDMNDVLQQHGMATVAELINRAKPYPVSGVYTYSELPIEPDLHPVGTGWPRLDLRLFYPGFMVVTGFAGSGKSTWTNQLVAQLNLLHGWKAAIASFEMRINPFVSGTLLQTRFDMNGEGDGEAWLDDNFVFIAPEPSAEDLSFDVDWLIDKAATAVIRHGIRVLVIDPWNEIEHAMNRRESMTDYTGRAIRALKRFGREFEVLVIVVAHPTKSAANKAPEDVSLYDVSDCYSSDTDVLTRRGWLPFPQVTLADEVSCFDMESAQLFWAHPSRIIRQPYSGEMAHFKGQSFDLLVTPNHRMVLMPVWKEPKGTQKLTGFGRPVRWIKNKWQFATSKDVSGSRFWIPIAPGLPEGTEPQRIELDHGYAPDDFVDFIGWYLAEGHETGVSINLSQGKEPYVSEIRDLLGRMEIDFHEGISSAVGVHPLATMDTLTFGVRKRKTPQLVEWMRQNCGRLSDQKKIPEAIYDLSPRLKRRLLDAFIRGDGSFAPKGKRREASARATTTSPFLVDGFQRIAVECGISCTIGPKRQVQKHHKPSWQLGFTFGRKAVGLDLQFNHLKWEKYDGDVYCLTVPSGAFMVRRNGRPAVSGNSAHFANKADFGVIIARKGGPQDFVSEIFVRKLRYQPLSGRPGSIELVFDPVRGTFGQ